ncbi:hypothetical protein J2W14_001673 [Pseudarthrobacter oxydans]|uniref:DUF4012 domain-containing protein n=1 Tax=Pseudarthrobacter oxydans TaxID=1671 RepID=UPI0027868B51|nr:DUF4012 domain-containing protein [Pseudarthrobacter oxydans]MDP9982285.1 hypothetical protein [Pseudarthrobacter oxydans]
MTEPGNMESDEYQQRHLVRSTMRPTHRKHRYVVAAAGLTAAVLLLAAGSWLGTRATTIKNELEATAQLIPVLKAGIAANDTQGVSATADQLRAHAATAREASGDPLWTLAASVPWVGANFAAISEVARSADDVATLGVGPLVRVYDSLDWSSLLPSSSGTNLAPIQDASPSVSAAAHAVRASAERLSGIDASSLWPQVAEPLTRAREQLQEVTGALDASANAARIAPGMLGINGPRNYLLMIQNNAEARASGGIPGALAVLTLDNGKLTLGTQSSAGEVGVMSPVVSVDEEQQQIYSTRLGKYMQDVNLTPDFPTAAASAQAMWERKTGQRVDGVISMDPISLGYVLDATGPVEITEPELLAVASGGLPTQLSGANVVPTLLSDVYAKIALPQYQDVYFAGVAKEVFGALSTGGKGDAKGLIEGISRGASESRILLWSGLTEEQSVIARYPVSGSIAGPSVAPAQFGVYFNDGTGAKMDYYVKRNVQLVKNCDKDGYEQTTVRVTSTNTAPADAATSLPPYVTAGGFYGVPAGSVRTNVIAYGPVQANVETAAVDGEKTDFAAHRHANRPVGAVTVTLAPGQSSTVELTFGKIVQHAEPNVVVTPTVQPVKDVILATQNAACH